jgi:chemotaxis regulatin CheY-phosphate phosphatase CheZ
LSDPQVQQLAGLADLPQILLQAYAEITGVITSLRKSRIVLEQTTVEKIQHTNQKLREVTSATEIAATDIMDTVDRAMGLIDELDGEEVVAQPERGAEIRGELRDELFGVMTCLQFQDITTQQLNYASSVLVDMEQRLAELARIFEPSHFGLQHPVPEPEEPRPQVTFDRDASTEHAETRQALADEIFTVRGG